MRDTRFKVQESCILHLGFCTKKRFSAAGTGNANDAEP